MNTKLNTQAITHMRHPDKPLTHTACNKDTFRASPIPGSFIPGSRARIWKIDSVHVTRIHSDVTCKACARAAAAKRAPRVESTSLGNFAVTFEDVSDDEIRRRVDAARYRRTYGARK